MIVGISGKAGAGKDTIAGRLVDVHGFTKIAWADPGRMKRIIIAIVLLVGACREPGQPDSPPTTGVKREWLNDHVYVVHDDARRVTCWVYTAYPDKTDGAISCLPDPTYAEGPTVGR